MYRLTTSRGTTIEAPVICIAGGLGCFEPRKPPIPDIETLRGQWGSLRHS